MKRQSDAPNYIKIVNPKREIRFTGCPTVLELAIRENLPLSHSCGGMGTCGTCRVVIKAGLESLPARNEIEEEMATSRGFSDNERLACQTTCIPGLVIRLPNP